MGNENRCVCCDAIIPEGFMVCPQCQKTGSCTHLWVYMCMERGADGTRYFSFQCSYCGKHRREKISRSRDVFT